MKPDKIMEKFDSNTGEVYTDTETYTRDYWLKLYAGMAMQGLLADKDLSFSKIVAMSQEVAHDMVNTMFGDES